MPIILSTLTIPALFFQSDDINELSNSADTTLKNLLKWCEVNSLEINITKTKAVLFCTAQKKGHYFGFEPIPWIRERRGCKGSQNPGSNLQ